MKKIITAVIVLLLIVPVFSTILPKARATTYSWPTFHADNARTGYSGATSSSTNRVEWSYLTGGEVMSSPAIVDNKVYVGSNDGRFYAFDQSSGSVVWSYNTGEAI